MDVNNNSSTKRIAQLTGALTLLLALFSFVLSFNSLTELADEHDVSIPFLFPFLVEFGVVIFSLNALYRSLNGESAKWQWALIIGSSLLAGSFNIVHAKPEFISRLIAAMPSLFLVLSFETFLQQVKYSTKRNETVQSLEVLQRNFANQQVKIAARLEQMKATLRQKFAIERDKLQSEIAELSEQSAKLDANVSRKNAELGRLKADTKAQKHVNAEDLQEARRSKLQERRSRALQLQGEGLTEQQICEALGVKDVRTIRGYLQVENVENGNGVSK